MSRDLGIALRRLDPWRIAALALAGAALVLVSVGPLYNGACGAQLQAGGSVFWCELALVLEVPFLGLVVGLLAGLVARGWLGWIPLLAGVLLGGMVGWVATANPDRVLAALALGAVPLAIGYGLGYLIGRARRRGATPGAERAADRGSSGPAALAATLLLGAVAAGSAVVASQMPREWVPPARTAGTAILRLNELPGLSFESAVTCDWNAGMGRYTGFHGRGPGVAGGAPDDALGYFSLDVESMPGVGATVGVELVGPGPVPSFTSQDVRYQADVPVTDIVGPADRRTGRLDFSKAKPVPETTDTGGNLRSNPALPRRVSGSMEWSCADYVAATPTPEPSATPTPEPSPTPTLGPADVQVTLDTGVLTATPRELRAGDIVFEVDARAHLSGDGPMLFGPATDEQLELLRSGEADWRGELFGAEPGTVVAQSWQPSWGRQKIGPVAMAPGTYVLLTVKWVAGESGTHADIEAYELLTVVP